MSINAGITKKHGEEGYVKELIEYFNNLNATKAIPPLNTGNQTQKPITTNLPLPANQKSNEPSKPLSATQIVCTPLGLMLRPIQFSWKNKAGIEIDYTAFYKGDVGEEDAKKQCRAALSAIEEAAGDKEDAKEMIYKQLCNIDKTTEGHYVVRARSPNSTTPEIVLRNPNSELKGYFGCLQEFGPEDHAQISGLVRKIDFTRAKNLTKSKQVAKSQPSGFRMSATPTSPLDQLKRDLEKAAGTGFFSNQLEKLTKCVQGKKDKLKHEEKELLVRVSEHLKELGEYHTDMRKKYSETHSEKLGRIAEFLDACEKSELPIFKIPLFVKSEYAETLMRKLKTISCRIEEDMKEGMEDSKNVKLTFVDEQNIQRKAEVCNILYKDIRRINPGNIYIKRDGLQDNNNELDAEKVILMGGRYSVFKVYDKELVEKEEIDSELIAAKVAYRLQTSLLTHLPCLRGCEKIPNALEYAISQIGSAKIPMSYAMLFMNMKDRSSNLFSCPRLGKSRVDQLISSDKDQVKFQYFYQAPILLQENNDEISGYLSATISCTLKSEDAFKNWTESWDFASNPKLNFQDSNGVYNDRLFHCVEEEIIDAQTNQPVQERLVWKTLENFKAELQQ